MMHYPCAKFGDLGLSRFGFIVRADRQTDRITESQRRMIAILTRLYTASVSKARFPLPELTGRVDGP